MGNPSYQKPNRNAPVAGVALSGQRRRMAPVAGAESTMPSASPAQKSSDNTANYASRDQKRSGN